MTKKEINIQMALGTLDTANLSSEEFSYFISIVYKQMIGNAVGEKDEEDK